jgi:hypothetical protein
MRRMLATLVFGVGTVGAIGCAGNASYVKQFPDGGVIALKAGGDQAEVRKMIEKHVGPDFDIDVIDPNIQQAGFDPTKPTAATKAAPGEMHYVYKKKAKADLTGFPAAPGGGLPGGAAGVGGMGGAGTAGGFQPGAGGAGMPGGSSAFGTNTVGPPPAAFPQSR